MPIAPKIQKKIANQPPEGFRPYSKKVWDPPNRNTYTVEDLAKELGVISSSLHLIAATLAQPCEAEKLGKTKDELMSAARHLESVHNRLLSHGIMTHQPGNDTITVYHADDIPW